MAKRTIDPANLTFGCEIECFEVGPHSFSRYHSVNVTNILGGRRPTVEFRLFAGTTSELKAVMNIRLALGVVHRALEMGRSAKWDAERKNANTAKTAGRWAVRNMMAELGWTGPDAGRKVFGLFGAEAPDLEACKAEAIRLATKYDGGSDD
jgi:hypothetical protein